MNIKRIIKAKILKWIGSKRPIDFEIKNAKNILFFRYDRIGDMIITTPVFRELKLQYPEINITVLSSKLNKEVILNNPYIDHIITNHKNNFFADFPSLLKLRNQRFDICVEFDHSVVLHAIIRLKIIRPKKVISIKKNGRYGINGKELTLYDIYTEKKEKSHFRDIWLDVLKPFDIEPKNSNYDLFISDLLKSQAKKFLEQYSSKFLVGINLEGAIKDKRISFSELNQICQRLYQHNNNIQVIILTTPKNFHSVNRNVLSMNLDYVVMSYVTDTILFAAALINELDLIISPDTSISHVASTFNKPILTIHENNYDSYELFKPTSELNRTVFSKSHNSLSGFSIDLVIDYFCELTNLMKKEGYGK